MELQQGLEALKVLLAKQLNFDPKALPIVKFAHLSGKVADIPHDIACDLSTDQKYLLRICLRIQVGHSSTSPEEINFLQYGQPGALNHMQGG